MMIVKVGHKSMIKTKKMILEIKWFNKKKKDKFLDLEKQNY